MALSLPVVLSLGLTSRPLLHGRASLTANGRSALAGGHAVGVRPGMMAGAASTATQPLHVRIDDQWFDLSKWRVAHPSGPHWIDGFSGRDATEIFYAFHSDEASAMVTRLPKASSPTPSLPPTSDLTIAFRKLRADLVREGWFKRVMWRELLNMAPIVALFGVGTAVARTMPLLATICLGVGSTSAGWVGHDMIHGRGKFCTAMRGFAGFFNGHSPTWWSQKHNLHHAVTNVVGQDEDIMSDPFFYLWAPDPARDSKWRRLQHLYVLPVYSILFALWRFNSLKTVHTLKLHKTEGPLILLNYLWMALFLPPAVAIGHIFLAGVMTATIVTVSHQTEEMLEAPEDDWVLGQMLATRDAETSNPFSEWLWGGMQYQLEHHLFPTMPRYRYPALVPKVKALCEAHGVEYRVDGELDIVKRNWDALREIAHAEPVEGAPSTRQDTVWSRRQGAAWVGTNVGAEDEEDEAVAAAGSPRSPQPQMLAAAPSVGGLGGVGGVGAVRRLTCLLGGGLASAVMGSMAQWFPEMTAAAGAAECDEACKARIAERRQLFEQSRTTNDRQKILDLSRQRAALYNTTFQGASCISGLPCL